MKKHQMDKTFYHFPEISLGNVILREILISDAQNYLDYMNRKEMYEFLTEDNIPKNIEQAQQEVRYWGSLFRNKVSVYWALATKQDNKLIGTIGFNSIYKNHLRADISYDLNPDHWGKGIMMRAVNAVSSFAEESLGIVRIQATVATFNTQSIRLLEKSNFLKEGVLKKYELIENEHKDYFLYAKVSK